MAKKKKKALTLTIITMIVIGMVGTFPLAMAGLSTNHKTVGWIFTAICVFGIIASPILAKTTERYVGKIQREEDMWFLTHIWPRARFTKEKNK